MRGGRRLVVAGRSNAENGAALLIGPRPASTHVTRRQAKLGIACRAVVIAFAHRLDLA